MPSEAASKSTGGASMASSVVSFLPAIPKREWLRGLGMLPLKLVSRHRPRSCVVAASTVE